MAENEADSLNTDRLFPIDSATRNLAREIYKSIKSLPIVSPHGHTEAQWFSENQAFSNASELLVQPDHYILRMLYSQGISLEEMGIQRTTSNQGSGSIKSLGSNNTLTSDNSSPDPREVWRKFAENYYLFRGTPSSIWLNQVFFEVFGIDRPLNSENSDFYYDKIGSDINKPEFLPRSLFERFNIEILATTDSAVAPLNHHKNILESNWNGRVLPTFRPDSVIDPDHENFAFDLKELARMTDIETDGYETYIKALKKRRKDFIKLGATATDHGPATPFTTRLSLKEASEIFGRCRIGDATSIQRELFRGHMLIEMAKMSLEDDLVMQIHPGSFRNHNPRLFKNFGRDIGADIPQKAEFVNNLKPLLDEVGNEPDLTIILFTLDETTYSRELAPLAGHYPALKLGPAWWFHDSVEGMKRYREQVTETAGFYNTVGFNDDTRAFFSIPARHDVARRVDSSILAKWVCEHRISEFEAFELAKDLTYNLVKKAYRLNL